MDLKVPITLTDELTEDVITATAWLDLASGDVRGVEYEDYDLETRGPPVHLSDYEFTSGTLSNKGREVEFRVDVNRATGAYSVSPDELLEIKKRAAALFTGRPREA